MVLIDANIVLRYLLDDHDVLSAKAAEILESQTAMLPIEAACKVVYVLQKVYQVERPVTAEQLAALLNGHIITIEKADVFIAALAYYGQTRLDFVDTLLWAYRKVEKQTVLTFDKKLQSALERLTENT